MTTLSALTVDELADGICLRAGRIAAAQAELLQWIAEFDRREGWAGPGMLSCAHWLSWRTGLSGGTARDRVRVARRLEDLPQLAAAYADGLVSYSKVRAITRVADPDDGIDWIELARHSSAAQLDRLVRGVHRARANEHAQQDPDAAAWRLRTRTAYDAHGDFVLTIRGPAHLLPVITAGLDAKKQQLLRNQHEQSARAGDGAAVASRNTTPAASAATAATAAGPSGKVTPSPEVSQDRAATDDANRTHEPSSGSGGRDDPALDEQAPGWPAGTTRRRVLEALDNVTQLHRDLLTDPGPADDPDSRPTARPAAAPRARTSQTRTPDTAAATGSAAGTTLAAQPAVTDAEALAALADDALDTERATRPDLTRQRRPRLTLQIDPLSGWARMTDGELLPPSSLQTLLTTLPGGGGVLRLRPLTDTDLRRLDLGRTSRHASTALRELLGSIDGERCRFPGCTRHHRLHAHHVRFWRDDGPTDLANLVLVCSRHHTLIHTQGYQLLLHPDRTLEVRTATGTPVLHHPDQPWGDPASLTTCGRPVSAETLPPDHCQPALDLHYAVAVLMARAA